MSQTAEVAAPSALSRLDSAIERIASARPSTSSRANSVSTSSVHSAMPQSADPGYCSTIGEPAVSTSLPRRSATHDSTASASSLSDAHVNAQLYGYKPPPPPPQQQQQQLASSSTRGTATRERSAEDWADRGASRRVVQSVVNGERQERVIRKGVRDFNFARTLGEGSYSTVIAATDRQTLKEYAIKVLDKRHIIKEKKVKYVNIEKDTLFRLGDHPGVVRLYYTFQDESSLYFVLDLATNGELLGVLKKLTTFDEDCARYYSAQILDAIDYMHSKGVIHRDLKPENVLLDDKMRVKIADFGTAKLLKLPGDKAAKTNGNTRHDAAAAPQDGRAQELEGLEQSDRANSFVGTAEYVSPELLTDKSTCKSSDLWALGCILYQLLAGKPPFKAVNEYQTFQKIVQLDYSVPTNFPPKAADLIQRLLVLDPLKRLSVPEIRQHDFFAAIDWETLWKIKAPKLRPYRPPPIVLNAAPVTNRAPARRQSPSQPLLAAPLVSNNGNVIHNNHGHAYGPLTTTTTTTSSSSFNNNHRSMASHSLPQHHQSDRVRSSGMESTSPSELDLQYASILALPFERILRLGQLTVSTSEGDKLPRKFNKLLNRKKTRILLVTSHGRCLYLDASSSSSSSSAATAAAAEVEKRVRGEMNMTGPPTTIVRQVDAKSCIVESPSKSWLYEDASGNVAAWVEVLDEANRRVLEFRGSPYGNGHGTGHKVEEKRKSRITLGL